MIWKNVGQVAKDDNVTRHAITKRLKKGYYKHVKRTDGGHFRIGFESPLKTILYCRVSSAKQRSSLDTQERLLKEQYSGEVYRDTGSGFNFARKGFTRLLERIMCGDKLKIVATTQDRITRQGFPLIQRIAKFYDCEFVFLEEIDTPNNFSTETLVAFLTSYCNSQSGRRSADRHKKDKGVSKE